MGKIKDKKKENEKESGNENMFIKLLPALLTITGILVGVWQFNSEQDNRDKEEFRRNIWQKKLEVYEHLGNATAMVVNSTADSAIFAQSIKKFHNLYWGVLPMIQDENVEQAIISFNAEIRYFQRKESSVDDLRKKGYRLMTECKRSLNDSWQTLVAND